MSALAGTVITDPVVPADTTSVNPTHLSIYGKGGYREVADTTARDAIPAERRLAGMLVYDVSGDATYRLGGDLTTWTVVPTGGSGGLTFEQVAGLVIALA